MLMSRRLVLVCYSYQTIVKVEDTVMSHVDDNHCPNIYELHFLDYPSIRHESEKHCQNQASREPSCFIQSFLWNLNDFSLR